MIRWLAILLLSVASVALVGAQVEKPADAAASPRFAYVDVFIDTGDKPLAAYQFDFAAETGKVTVVGIEGGEHPAFAKAPPYYDPAALHRQGRVILAAFSTDADVPRGKTRVARIGVMIEGLPGGEQPKYAAKLEVAADPQGKAIGGAAVSVK